MACSIAIDHVSFLTGVTPQRIRVYGRAPGCSVVQLTTATPTVTSPVSVTPNAVGGRFMLEATLMQVFSCGAANPPTIIVSCLQTTTPNDPCMDAQWVGPVVPCCEGKITNVNAFVPQGSLTPTAINVQGECYGCESNSVLVSAVKRLPGGGTVTLTTPTPVTVDPVTGVFTGSIPLIGAITCEEEIEVTAVCSSGTCPIQSFREKLACPQCFRAELLVNITPCAQPTDTSTQVTITARIGLPGGVTRTFEFDYGNGDPVVTFPIPPAGGMVGGSGVVYTQVFPVATYNTGQQFTATLRIPGLECPAVSITFFVDCGGCPDATASVVVGNCIEPGPMADPRLVGTRPVTFTVNVPAGVPANLTTKVSFSYGGPDKATSNPAATPPFPGNSHSVNPLPSRMGAGTISETVFLLPGTYLPTAALYFSQGNQFFCLPSPPLDLTSRPTGQPPAVDVLNCLPCPPGGVRISKSQNPPTPPHWKFQADVDWGQAPPPPPPSPVSHDWTITAPNGDKAIAHRPPPAGNTITTENGQGWTGTLATPNGGIQLTQAGHYSVSVVANFAHNSGLPLDPLTMEVGCNTTAGEGFDIVGQPPPNCQTLGGVNQTTPAGMSACADPTQGIVATIDFTATGTNLGPGPYQWDFGDPASGAANTATSSTPTARHTYSSTGSFPVKVSILAAGGCPQTDWTTGVTVPLCPCPPGLIRLMNGTCGPPPGSSGEGLGCLILRWIAVALVSLGIIGALILLCLWPQLSQLQQGIIMGIGIGLFVVGIILFIIWVIVCPVKPCLWGWLLAGQVCLTVALVCSYMTYCCLSIFVTSAIIFGILAIIFLAIWIYRCMPTLCQVLIELTPVVSDVIAMIAIVAIVPFLRNCLNPYTGVVVGVLSAILVSYLASSCTGTPTKTGAPAR